MTSLFKILAVVVNALLIITLSADLYDKYKARKVKTVSPATEPEEE